MKLRYFHFLYVFCIALCRPIGTSGNEVASPQHIYLACAETVSLQKDPGRVVYWGNQFPDWVRGAVPAEDFSLTPVYGEPERIDESALKPEVVLLSMSESADENLPTVMHSLRQALTVPVRFVVACNKEPSESLVTSVHDGFGKEVEWVFGPGKGMRLHDALSRAVNHSRMFELAFKDWLTGAFSRRAMERQLAQLAKSVNVNERRARQSQNALLYFDIDRFKEVNSRITHAGGDVVLRTFVEVVRQTIRSGDMLARLGGEEFGLVLHDIDEAGAIAVAHKIRRAVESHTFALPENISQIPNMPASIQITVSVGLVMSNSVEKDNFYQSVLQRASTALLAAKETGGRNCVYQWNGSEAVRAPVPSP